MKPQRIQRPPSPLVFFDHLYWIDGRPLTQTLEPYRRAMFEAALHTFDADGQPTYNLVLTGRAKKNWKTTDLILAALYRFLAWPSPQGNDAFLLANDEGQANDDLGLAKKLIAVNPLLAREVDVRAKELVRVDGRGTLRILPAQDAIGAHGKTALFIGYDEIHGYRSWDIFEALAPDPTRRDVLQWVTSYASIYNTPGAPLHDMLTSAKRGDDPRMFFSWYAGDFTTDTTFADAVAEDRANPSRGSWADADYLDQQRRRLPTSKYRRLHLNLPGAPAGAALDAESIADAVHTGRRRLPPAPGLRYRAFVDMSGGSADDAVLAIAHHDEETGRAVLDLCESQSGGVPFNPRSAVMKFARLLEEYCLASVMGDAYAGETFRRDFEAAGIAYRLTSHTKSALYEALEPRLNAREVDLLDNPKLTEQLMTLVWRGTKIDHQPGDHDDFANAVAGAIAMARRHGRSPDFIIGQDTFITEPLSSRAPWSLDRSWLRREEPDSVIEDYYPSLAQQREPWE